MENKQKRKYSQAMAFVVLFGIVSLFSDMTHEGASSIRGAYLTLLGASAGTIGFISGLGELVGYSMRYVFGKLTDKTRHYWTMTIVGYVLDVLAVPALALVGESLEAFAFGTNSVAHLDVAEHDDAGAERAVQAARVGFVKPPQAALLVGTEHVGER